MGEVDKYVELIGNTTIRDERAIKKIISAFMKLLFPNLQFDNSELRVVVEYAVEMRQMIRDWLHKLSPGEFPKEKLTYTIKS